MLFDTLEMAQKAAADTSARELQALYGKQQFQQVVDRFESVRQRVVTDDVDRVVALQIVAQAYSCVGNFLASADAFLSAAAIHVSSRSPRASQCMRNAFAALQRLSRNAAAEWVALRSLSLPRECGGDVEMLRYAVARAIKRGDLNAATCIIAAASLYGATRTLALETLLDMAFQPAKYGASNAAAQADALVDARDPKLSIIICSRDDARYAKFITECEGALCSSHFEIIRIADAKSMCEGYNRGTDAATGELLLFCHDDIEFITGGVHRALINALTEFDVACSVGSSVVDSPTWMCRDATNSQGWIAATDTASGRYSLSIIGVPNLQSLLAVGDGFFIACRKAAAQTLRWDDTTFDSFHLYDLDFCLRARNHGFRVGVVRDVAVNHLSQGTFNADWREHAQRFLEKHSIPYGPDALNQWISIQVGTRDDAARVARNLTNWVPADFQGNLAKLQESSFEAACIELPAFARFRFATAELAQ